MRKKVEVTQINLAFCNSSDGALTFLTHVSLIFVSIVFCEVSGYVLKSV